MRLILVRHGQTDAAYAGRYVGASDPSLSALGRDQARELAARLPDDIGCCLCSPLCRARETARLALVGRTCPIEVMGELREVDFGRWEGLSFAEILDRDAALVADWQRDPPHFHFPDGESTAVFRARVAAALEALARQPQAMVLAVCHGGVIRAMLCQLLDLPFARYLSFHVQPAAMTVLDVEGGRGVLRGLNL